MALQTTFNTYPTGQNPGQIVTLVTGVARRSGVCGEVDGIPFGAPISVDDKGVITIATGAAAGIAVLDYGLYTETANVFEHKSTMDYTPDGEVWALGDGGAFASGGKVYWDAGAKKYTATSAGNVDIGAEFVRSGDDAMIAVKLSG
ncbi:DUF2190 family protein [Pseudovibrio sp. POLY-S9]|uniref:DUF2190 family protein n=1 Tax=Pseudovibrio sp. POLY-S9 TaxID=1576596 RepID=UPI00070C4667|nr:DUF2190 family protein [Pseudovibrio sp. POLY-S9]